MYVVKISISDFLDRALSISDGDAHASSEFAGLAVLIARTADAEAIQDGLFDQWESLNDLTDRRVLFITASGLPSTRASYPADGVTVGGGDAGTVAHVPGLQATPIASSYDWQREFHAALSVPRASEDGMVSASPPCEKPDLKVGITRIASELADFFGLSERELPCLVLVSMWEHDVYVISLNRGFDLYDFFRSVVIHYDGRGGGPTSRQREVRKVEERMIEIKRFMPATRGSLDRVRSRVSREQTTWKHHRDDARGLLRWLAKHGRGRADEARIIERLIETESALSEDHLAIIDELITYIQADSTLSSTKAGYDLCRRLGEVAERLGGGLPGASDIARKVRLRGEPPGSSPPPLTAAEIKQVLGTELSDRRDDLEVAVELEQRLTSWQTEVELLAARRRQLLQEIRDPRVRTGLSDAIRDAAAERKLTDYQEAGEWRSGWTRVYVRQQDTERRLATTLK